MIKTAMFALGGAAYVGLELLWRGRSHVSMFAAGGVCFLILGAMSRENWKIWKRGLMGAAAITEVELATGLLVNRSYAVWDYRELPLNYFGQICLPYTMLWVPLSVVAMVVYPKVEAWLIRRKAPLA